MKHVKIVAKFSVSEEFYKSDSFQELKRDILQNKTAKELEMEGDVFDMKITFTTSES